MHLHSCYVTDTLSLCSQFHEISCFTYRSFILVLVKIHRCLGIRSNITTSHQKFRSDKAFIFEQSRDTKEARREERPWYLNGRYEPQFASLLHLRAAKQTAPFRN